VCAAAVVSEGTLRSWMVSSAMRPLLGSPILKVLRGAGFGSLVTAGRPAGSQRAAHAGDN
jgi:hypothetical protein